MSNEVLDTSFDSSFKAMGDWAKAREVTMACMSFCDTGRSSNSPSVDWGRSRITAVFGQSANMVGSGLSVC